MNPGVRRPARCTAALAHAVRLALVVSAGGLVGRVLPVGSGTAVLIAGAASMGVVLLAAGPSARDRLDRCLRAPAGAVPSSVPSSVPVSVPVSVPSTRSRPGQARFAGLRPRPDPVRVALPVPVVIDLVASVIEAGAPPEAALRLVSRTLSRAGDPAAASLTEQAGPAPQWRPLFTALQLARSVGLGPVGLLRSAAAEQRRRRAEALSVAARRLAVLAVLPTSLCLLPAFVLLTVVPLVLGLFPA